MNQYSTKLDQINYQTYREPELSEWRCELFGTGPHGITLRPIKGREPNRFWRWMQYLCFGNRWRKVP